MMLIQQRAAVSGCQDQLLLETLLARLKGGSPVVMARL
jgi:hypothetical protein